MNDRNSPGSMPHDWLLRAHTRREKSFQEDKWKGHCIALHSLAELFCPRFIAVDSHTLRDHSSFVRVYRNRKDERVNERMT